MEKIKNNYKNSSLEENYIKEKLNPKFISESLLKYGFIALYP